MRLFAAQTRSFATLWINPLVMEEQSAVPELAPPEPEGSMAEYYQLRQELLYTTLVLLAIAFPCVWYFYDLNIALNYLLGAVTGVVYLRLLAKNVERLGQTSGKAGKSQVAVFVGVIIVATQVDQLHVLPVFLGFLTFKVSLLLYTVRIVLTSDAAG
jgi:ATP synthase protein I